MLPDSAESAPSTGGEADSALGTGGAEAELGKAGSSDASRVLDMFDRDCTLWEGLYPFRLDVKRVFAVNNPKLEQCFEHAKGKLRSEDPNVRRLYHGTSAMAARAIIKGGFELPEKTGMFGKGIYFAETPLKSWQYSQLSRVMLVCDVALGQQAALDREGEPALLSDRRRARYLEKLESDSVVGLSKDEGGVLRAREFVIYKAERAVPRYLLELTRTARPAAEAVGP